MVALYGMFKQCKDVYKYYKLCIPDMVCNCVYIRTYVCVVVILSIIFTYMCVCVCVCVCVCACVCVRACVYIKEVRTYI